MHDILGILLLVGLAALYYLVLPRLDVPTCSPLSRTSCGSASGQEQRSDDDARDDVPREVTESGSSAYDDVG